MRKFLVPIMASLALASPALATEARVEARGGVIWNQGEEEAVAGIAGGYDFDLGSTTFAGFEASADKILTGGTRVSWGVGGRLGAKLSEAGKVYANGGWSSKHCRTCDESLYLGAGYQHNLGSNLYGKVEYRHHFFDNGVSDPDSVTAGVGLRF